MQSLTVYNLQLEYIAGKQNIVADTLSRAPIPVENQQDKFKINIFEIKASEIQFINSIQSVNLVESTRISDHLIDTLKMETSRDYSFQILADFIVNGWPERISLMPDEVKIYNKYQDELSVQNGLIFRNDKILIPQRLRRLITEKIHVAHSGIENCIKLARENVFWPNINSDIREKVQSCDICAQHSSTQQNPPMQTHEIPVYPFQYVSMDVFYEKIKGKTERILVTVDHYSDFFELDILENMSAKSVVDACKKNFGRHGIPRRVCTDNGTNFVSREFTEFSNLWNFKHVTSSPYHQQGNGKAEATVKIAKNLIIKAEESNTDFWYGLLHLRNTPNKINSSPVQRIFSRRTRTGLPATEFQLKPKVVENVPQQIIDNRKISKSHYDKKSRLLPELKIGQPVDVQVGLAHDTDWRKGKIEKQLKDRSFLVNVGGSLYQRSRVNIKPQKTGRPDVVKSEHQPTLQASGNSSQIQSESSETTISQTPPESQLNKDSSASLNSCPATNNDTNDNQARPRRTIRLPDKLKDYIVRRE